MQEGTGWRRNLTLAASDAANKEFFGRLGVRVSTIHHLNINK